MDKKYFLGTGFEELDNLLGGLKRGSVNIFSSSQNFISMAFFSNVIDRVIQENDCMTFGFGFDMIDCLGGLWRDGETDKFDDYLKHHKVNLFVDDFSLWEIIIESARQKVEYGLDFLFIKGFSQLSAKERVESMKALKALAERLGIVILVDVKLKNKNFRSRSLRHLPKVFTESADNVIFLDLPYLNFTVEEIVSRREEMYKAQVFVAKNETGKKGIIQLKYDPSSFRFSSCCLETKNKAKINGSNS